MLHLHVDGEVESLAYPLTKETSEILRSRRTYLIDNIYYSTIADSLLQHVVISGRHKASIEETLNGFDRVGRLLDILQRRSMDDFYRFIKCLEETGHTLMAETLKSNCLNSGSHFVIHLKLRIN